FFLHKRPKMKLCRHIFVIGINLLNNVEEKDMNAYNAHPHFIDLQHWGKFERLVLQVLEQFKLRLDEFALKTFSKIAWRWRHSKLNVSGVKVIQLTVDDLV